MPWNRLTRPVLTLGSFVNLFRHRSSGQPGFLNARKQAPPPSVSWIRRFIREEVTSPEKRAGNISLAWGITVFAAGIAFARNAGDLLVPVF